MPTYMKSTPAAIDKLKAAGIEVVICTVTPSASMVPQDWFDHQGLVQVVAKDNVAIRKLAKDNACAIAEK